MQPYLLARCAVWNMVEHGYEVWGFKHLRVEMPPMLLVLPAVQHVHVGLNIVLWPSSLVTLDVVVLVSGAVSSCK